MPRLPLSLSLIAALPFILAPQARAEITIQTVPVANNLQMLIGQGGNIGLFTGPQGTFMIDDQFAPLTEAVLQAIRDAGGKDPDYLVNTHFHGDHTGGNENLGRLGTLIVAQDNVRTRLAEGSFIKPFKMELPPQQGSALPVLTFSRDIRFHLNGEKIEVLHLPRAHTDGDSVIHFTRSNVIHAGDLFFNGFYPFVDIDHGGSLKGMINGVDRLLSLANEETRIIPGHGPLARKPQLMAYRDMLFTAYQRLKAASDAGKSLDAVIAEKPLADLEKQWGGGFLPGDQWIGIVYSGLD